MSSLTTTSNYWQIRNSPNTTTKSGRVRKSSKDKRERTKTLEKLRDMVGSEASSQLEIMQHVIDYIWHLQQKLSEPESIPSTCYGIDTKTPLHQLVSQFANAFAVVSTSIHS